MSTSRGCLAIVVAILSSGCHGSGSNASQDLSMSAGDGDLGSGGSVADLSVQPDGGVPPGCSGQAITVSGSLDFDVRAIHVSGSVTLNGARLPDAQGRRGALQFVNQKTGASAQVTLGATGAASYDITIDPGVYDLSWAGEVSRCADAPMTGIPCISGPLKKGLALTTSGSLDIDVPAIQVTGNVTLKGAAMPTANGSRGYVRFTLAGGGSVASTLGTSGNATYALALLPGPYDVSLTAEPARCADATMTGIPCIGGPLKQGLALTTTGSLDVDIPAIQVTGKVTLNGAAMPTASGSRGYVRFTLAGGGTVASTLGTSGDASYALALLPGLYDVSLTAELTRCADSPMTGIPCMSGPLRQGLALTTSGSLDVDIPAIQVTGKVTLNGAAMPAASGSRGYLRFTLAGGGTVASTLGTSGDATYALALLPGPYDVSLTAELTRCGDSPMTGIPCVSGPLKQGLALTTSGSLDVDIPAIQVTGNVTLNGAAMPTANGSRGYLRFTLAGGGTLATTLGSSGNAPYALALLPGHYDVSLNAEPTLCSDATMTGIPCISGPLKQGLALTTSGSLDVDIPAIQVTGNVTLNGAAMPAAADRGSLAFTLLSGGAVTRALGSTGAASYALTLLPGRYVVQYASPSAPAAAFPANAEILFGCP